MEKLTRFSLPSVPEVSGGGTTQDPRGISLVLIVHGVDPRLAQAHPRLHSYGTCHTKTPPCGNRAPREPTTAGLRFRGRRLMIFGESHRAGYPGGKYESPRGWGGLKQRGGGQCDYSTAGDSAPETALRARGRGARGAERKVHFFPPLGRASALLWPMPQGDQESGGTVRGTVRETAGAGVPAATHLRGQRSRCSRCWGRGGGAATPWTRPTSAAAESPAAFKSARRHPGPTESPHGRVAELIAQKVGEILLESRVWWQVDARRGDRRPRSRSGTSEAGVLPTRPVDVLLGTHQLRFFFKEVQ